MSTKIGIISEGPIDHALLPALLSRIAHDKAQFRWPLDATDVAELFPIRKRGHGGVLDTVRRLVRALDSKVYDHACFVIILDRRTRAVQEKVRELISRHPRFVLGIAIEEIEAWWLGDRTNTFAWTGLSEDRLPSSCKYGKGAYQAEKDKYPKNTLDQLTRLSGQFDAVYGDGHSGLARDFADRYWAGFAKLDEIASQCPKGYGRFEKVMVNAFRRAKAMAGRLL